MKKNNDDFHDELIFNDFSNKDQGDESRIEWERGFQGICDLWQQISRRSSEDPEFARKVSKERQEFNFIVVSLPKEYGKPQDYAAFHHFAGGSTNYEYSPKLDLPGKYSVVKFYQRCIDGDFPLQEGRSLVVPE